MPAMRTGLPFESRIWLPLVCQYPAPTPGEVAAAAGPAPAAVVTATEPAAATIAVSAPASVPASRRRVTRVIVRAPSVRERPGQAGYAAWPGNARRAPRAVMGPAPASAGLLAASAARQSLQDGLVGSAVRS